MEKGSKILGKKADKDFTALRGLTARVTWVEAIGLHCEESRVLGMGYAEMRAFLQGHEDFHAGRVLEDVPPLLADVQVLAAQWRQGWLATREIAAVHSGNGSDFVHAAA